MAFQVTQCPRCESTFNTDPRVLELAAGKVRCGACLTVFQVEENFLTEDAADSAEHESVFVGNAPEDFFDPAVFLTRSALQEHTEIQAPDTQPPHFPAADESPMEVEATPETLRPDPDIVHTPPTDIVPEEPPTASFAEADDLAPASSTPEPDVEQSSESSHLEFFAAVNESLDDVQEYDAIEDLQTIAELKAMDNPNADMFTTSWQQSFADEEPSEDEIEAVLAGELDDEFDTVTASEASAAVEAEESRPVDLDAIRKDLPHRPEEISLSVSFAVEPRREEAAAPQQGLGEEPEQGSSKELQRPLDEELQRPLDEEPQQCLGEKPQQFPEEEPQPFLTEAPRGDPDDSEPLTEEFNAAIAEDEFAQTVENGPGFDAGETPIDLDIGNLEAPHEIDSIAGSQVGTATIDDLVSEPIWGKDTAEETVEIEQGEAVEEVDTSTEAIRARARQAQYQDDDALEAIPREHLQALGSMTPPVELTSGMPRSWGRNIVLAILCLVLGATLAGQYAWREIDRYAQEPLVRTAFQWLCTKIGCTIPAYVNIDAIASSNLTVRSHPDREDALIVAVEMRNTAQFPQAFPVMVLSFNSASNQLIALREFFPEEYLDPGLRDVTLMPVMTPVQVTMEIIDPGGDAMNYTMAFRLP
jgi:predicted Zn finger-like uncharacterized protein